MSQAPQPSQRLPAGERREQILRCAIRLYEERPHTEVSTADIATAAGVARPLVHHYFGTHQQLYLEVLRRLYFLGPVDPAELSGATLEERSGELLDRWLTRVERHRTTWLGFTAGGGPGADPDVVAILGEADTLIAKRLLDALELSGRGPERDAHLLALVVAWSGLAKSAVRQWLADATLARTDVRRLLGATLQVVLNEGLAAALPATHVGEEDVEGERPDRERQSPLDAADPAHDPVEPALLRVVPRQAHGLPEHRR